MVFRMTDAGYYRGTTADQDTRFGDKTKKLMKTLKFSDQLNEPVDMRKVFFRDGTNRTVLFCLDRNK